MPRRQGLTDKQVAALPREDKRYSYADPELRGHYLRVPARSSRAPIAFAAVARNRDRKQIWVTVGTTDAMRIEQAREKAREAIRRIKEGRPTSEPATQTVEVVAEEWLERHVRGNKLRSAKERGRIISRYLIPNIGDRIFIEVRRRDITALLDKIEDENGKHTADAVLKVFRAISKWVQRRDEDYSPPLTAGMTRVPKEERRRTRILDDAEIKAIWNTSGQFGDFARLALLTAQRREKIRTVRWEDIKDGFWTIATDPREKGNPGKIRLPEAALEIIHRQPRLNAYVFAGQTSGPTAVFRSGDHKAAFDKQCGVENWRLHDLRRTARSLMSRAGVRTEIAERVLGHTQGELIQIYDRHHYQDEMAGALERLAGLIGELVR
jgi:integrase